MNVKQLVKTPTKHPFAARIEEAHDLYLLSKGTPHEETCWKYLEAVCALGRIANGLQRRAFIRDLAGVQHSAAHSEASEHG